MIRDWWRGYSDIDLASVRLKLRLARMWPVTGGMVALTPAEFSALRANSYAGRAGLI